MNKTPYNLNDTTFLINVRVDSEDRLSNLKLILAHIHKYFETNILLIEADKKQNVPSQWLDDYDVTYEFIIDTDKTLHTTLYRNLLVNRCKTPFFFVCDIDVIPAPQAIWESVEYMRVEERNILVYPYDGRFFDVSREIRDSYAQVGDYSVLVELHDQHSLWFSYSVGGIFGSKKASFPNEEVDNENIYGWGPDDKERYYRAKKNGFQIFHAPYPLYHLYHQRNENSKPAGYSTELKNKQEFLKIFNT